MTKFPLHGHDTRVNKLEFWGKLLLLHLHNVCFLHLFGLYLCKDYDKTKKLHILDF